MAEDDSDVKRKAHNARQAGVKAQKKKMKATKESNEKSENLTARQRNPKAFAINSAQRAERNFRRKEDLTAKKQHIPVIDTTPDVPPPVLIAVVGPPKVGKTLLITNLIKNFTRTNVNDVRGPITVVTSKKRRITLLECQNDINCMIDVAKCADLVLLLCDASYGFEMEIFEFLNICQVHGMPKIMGVLTHLDMIKNPKQLRKRKKELKHRFWTEVYDGAKLFYLSGVVHGEYLRNEIKNLGRFISIMKFRPLTWRGTHSYLLIDRVEDITNTDSVRRNPQSDRNVVLYGYVRGVPLKQEHMVHIAGVGDMRIDELTSIPDPCPLPGVQKQRSLLEKERLLYAPMSGVGGIVYDKDAVYIELQGSHSHKEKINEQQDMMDKLIDKKQTVDVQIEEQEFKLFTDGAAVKSKDFKETLRQENNDDHDNNNNDNANDSEEEDDDDDDDEDDDDDDDDDDTELANGREGWQGSSDEDDDEVLISSDDDEYQFLDKSKNDKETSNEEVEILKSNLKWKENLALKARNAFLHRHSDSKNLMRLVYGCYTHSELKKHEPENDNNDVNSENKDCEKEDLGGMFKVVAEQQHQLQQEKDIRDIEESCFFLDAAGETTNWLEDYNKNLLKNCFVTGKWKASEDAENLLRLDDMSDGGDSEVYGDFEDLETGEKHEAKPLNKTVDNKSIEVKETQGDSQKRKITRVEEENLTKAELMAKKIKLKAKFDAEYDGGGKKQEDDDGHIKGDHQFYESLKDEAQKQSEINKKEFENLDEDLRLKIEGFRTGLYVRLGFSQMPSEFIKHFDANYPVLIGALNMIEENVGFVNCKVKKHRWYKKILKTGDPLIISMGWRRFQTVPIYAKVEDNLRQRYLKYTPSHVTCNMTFWGPITPQNTGFLALQTVRQDMEEMKRLGFRIAATGSVSEMDRSAQIMKKLKLVGYPFKIYKKSAFIKDMFTTTLEVAKFEGAKIRTVSGIRGQIKKAHHTPEGSFRATFEDRILMSDIVFCRTWFRVDVPRFYAPITTLLLPPAEKTQWQGMKTLGQLKREKQIKNEAQPDSLYVPIKREPRAFKKLKIPKALQRALPYKDKPKLGAAFSNDGVVERVAVINSPHEQKVAKMLQMIETNYKNRTGREKQKTKLRQKEYRLQKQIEAENKLQREKELRKKVSRALSKMRRNQNT